MFEKYKIGFVYTVSIIGVDGLVKTAETVCNILPNNGRDYVLGAALDGSGQTASWYIGLYGNDYTPLKTDDMAVFLGSAGELTTYNTTNNTRLSLVSDAISGGVYSNLSTPAEFVFPNGDTARGGFISSGQYRENTAGLLLSAAKFPSPKIAEAGETIRVIAGLQLVT